MKKTLIRKTLFLSIALLIIGLFSSCSSKKEQTAGQTAEPPVQTAVEADPLKNKGIGPISEIVLGPIDSAMVAEGKILFDQLCVACHKANEDSEGPAPAGILERRTPEWVMNMIMNPEEMTEKDPIAKKLRFERNDATMADHNISEEEARKILEYFRTL